MTFAISAKKRFELETCSFAKSLLLEGSFKQLWEMCCRDLDRVRRMMIVLMKQQVTIMIMIWMNQYDVDDDNLPVPVVVIVFTKLATTRNNPTPHLSATVRK